MKKVCLLTENVLGKLYLDYNNSDNGIFYESYSYHQRFQLLLYVRCFSNFLLKLS